MGCTSSKSAKTNSGIVDLLGGQKNVTLIIKTFCDLNRKDQKLKKFFIISEASPKNNDVENSSSKIISYRPNMEQQFEKYFINVLAYGDDLAIKQQKLDIIGLDYLILNEDEYSAFKTNLKRSLTEGNLELSTQSLILKKQESLKKLFVQEDGKHHDYQIEKGVDPNCIYAKIGGLPTVVILVEQFYAQMLADKDVNQFFFNTDMQKQEERQTQFMAMLFGGPNQYQGKDMFTVHRGMNIEIPHYDKALVILGKVMHSLKISDDIIEQIIEIMVRLKFDITNSNPSLAQKRKSSLTNNSVDIKKDKK